MAVGFTTETVISCWEAVEASVKTEDSIYSVLLHYGEMNGVPS